MVGSEFELRASDSKSSALCSHAETVSTVKDTRRKRFTRPLEVRARFIEAMKRDGKCALKTE